ncbi:MAG: Wzz/FepE/Etk N-terminal domain-containing protein [Deltaproteobacteria bacterium]|nr:Wzz/FepE/Etk N-terminal domain-containing protein [Deltaproteobacteria bacterium]
MNEIRLMDYIRAVWKRRWHCFYIVLSVTTIAVIYSYFMPNVYQSSAVILPISPSSGGGASSVGGFLAQLPMVSGGGGIGVANDFVLFLNSQALRLRVVAALNLIPVLVSNAEIQNGLSPEHIINMAATRLGGMVSVKIDMLHKQKIIVSANGGDPVFITKVLRQYLVELQNFISTNALTQAKRHRLFLEKQLARNKRELLEMGKALASFYQDNPVSTEKSKLNVPVAMNTQTGVRNFGDYEEFKQHFNVLQKKEVDQQSADAKNLDYVRDVPQQVYLTYLQVQQQILEQNYIMLSSSHQSAMIEETKQEPSFQILEDPMVPLFRIAPKRRVIAMTAFGISSFLALFYSLFMEFYVPKKRERIFQEAEPIGIR